MKTTNTRFGSRKLRFEAMEEKTLLTTLWVYDGGDSGEGTFRDAVVTANGDSGISDIQFRPELNKVKLESTVEYSGSQRLQIIGDQVVIRPASNDLNGRFNLFESTGGGDLEFRDVDFLKGLTGVFVPVPKDASGTLDVTLKGVTIRDNSHFGIHIDDQKPTDLEDHEIWNEDGDGDLSNDLTEPTLVNQQDDGVLYPGVHRVSGSSTAGPEEFIDEMGIPHYPELDVDSFTIVIEAGTQLEAINLEHYSWSNPHKHSGGDGGVPGEGAFFAVQRGEQIFQDEDPGELLGAGLIGINPGAQQGENILDDLGSGVFSEDFGVPTFEGPLGPGTYTFWYQEGPTDTQYTLEFVVSDIAGRNSDVSINFVMKDSLVQGNGHGAPDADGVRIDEGGTGNLRFRSLDSVVKSNGGDGVELDEGGQGNATAYIHSSVFKENGEARGEDPEDGFDIDESGLGNLWFKVLDSYFDGNADDGIDLDEEDGGVVTFDFMNGSASHNGTDGTRVSEEGNGNLNAQIIGLSENHNGDHGLRIEEWDGGDNRTKINNLYSDKNGQCGVKVTEEGHGNLGFDAHQFTSGKNSESGLYLEEGGKGSLTAAVHDFDGNANGDWGIHVHEEDHGNLAFEASDLVKAKGNNYEGIYLYEYHGGNLQATLRQMGLSQIDNEALAVNESGPGDLGLDVAELTISGPGEVGIVAREYHNGSLDLRGDHVTVDNAGKQAIVAQEEGSGDLVAELSEVNVNNAGHDGIDLGETDSGNMHVKFSYVHVSKTKRDGAKLQENQEGDVYVEVHLSSFHNIKGDGLLISEQDNGDLASKFGTVSTSAKGDNVKIQEADAGDLVFEAWRLNTYRGLTGISLVESSDGNLSARYDEGTIDNPVGDGFSVSEKNNGSLDIRVVNTLMTGCGSDGVSAIEKGDGDFTGEITWGSLSADEFGARLEQYGEGEGSARIFGANLYGGWWGHKIRSVRLY